MPDLNLDDITLHYELAGDGPPMLLIAGFSSDSASWGTVTPLLQDRFRLIVPDNRTTGRTVPWDAPTNLGLNAADCAALLRHLETGPVHVVGHSMGGMVALLLAAEAPELVASLVIAGSAPQRSARNEAIFRSVIEMRRTPGAVPDLWLRALYPWIFRPALFDMPAALDEAAAAALAYPHLQSAEAMAHQLDGLSGHVFSPQKLPQPMLGLVPEHDLLFSEHDIRAALAAYGDPEIEIIRDAGHSVHWDQPQAVADAVAGFATRHPIGAPS